MIISSNVVPLHRFHFTSASLTNTQVVKSFSVVFLIREEPSPPENASRVTLDNHVWDSSIWWNKCGKPWLYHWVTSSVTLKLYLQAFIIAVTSNFIPEMVYMFVYNDEYNLDGYMNWTLSYFAVADFTADTGPNDDKIDDEFKNITFCR